ncbi:MAG TPA: diguanylate cyclase [Desulfomonilia bacterium]|jgi:diguanylate cyclase (GGDEF)-like protein
MKKILIVDDYPANIKVLGELLREKYEVLVATNGLKAVTLAREKAPDLILMDVMMPEMDGFSAASIIKKDKLTEEIPIIFITAKGETEDIVKGFEVGGQDYITKPFNPQELFARVNTHLELQQSKQALKDYALELEKVNNELKESNAMLEFMAWHDQLTGLPNRRYMRDQIKAEQNRSARSGKPFTLVMGDIDDFKRVNDTYGHETGDGVLKHISEIITASLRKQDLLSRWGGEEFLFLLPETDLDGAMIVSEKIRSSIEAEPYNFEDKSIRLTLTLGVAEFDEAQGIDGVIRRADDALYKGKKGTKNCVVAG